MSAEAPLAIGEVLEELRGEFPDVTISKIRFLESQGLVEPRRSASGYRQFEQADIDRLRWILRAQKEQFLPLRVIKERLASGALVFDESAVAAGPDAGGEVGAPLPLTAADGEPADAAAESVAEAGDATRDRAGDVAVAPASRADGLTRGELARAARLDDDQLAALEEYGLVNPSYVSRDRVLFDDESLAVARVAAGFLRHGLEPRHLRMYRGFAEREAALFEQVLLPYRRQRNPEARERGEAVLAELADLGRDLRGALLRQAARRALG